MLISAIPSSFNLDTLVQSLVIFGSTHGIKIVTSLIVLWIGWKLIAGICKAIESFFAKKNLDSSLRGFLSSLLSMGLKLLLVVTCAGIAGLPTTSLAAMIGAAGLAIGMALSGSLKNFAGGVLILILKPFKVGDFIETQGFSGTVQNIQIFNTILLTPDNKRIILPNGPVSTEAMTNFSAEKKRRVDFTFGIGYSDDIDKAKGLIAELIAQDKRIDHTPAPFIAVSELADSSVNLVVRVWSDASNYWDIHFELIEKVKKSFDANGISIPFPQRDVHVYGNTPTA